jgi:hypothetical protein
MFPGKSAGIIQGVASGKKELLRDIPEDYKVPIKVTNVLVAPHLPICSGQVWD